MCKFLSNFAQATVEKQQDFLNVKLVCKFFSKNFNILENFSYSHSIVPGGLLVMS